MTINWAWSLIPIILPFGRLGQENCYEMKDSLGYRRSLTQNSSKSDRQMLSPWIYWTFNTRFWLLRFIRRCEWGHRGHRGTLDWSLGNCFPEEGPFELEFRETEEERKKLWVCHIEKWGWLPVVSKPQTHQLSFLPQFSFHLCQSASVLQIVGLWVWMTMTMTNLSLSFINQKAKNTPLTMDVLVWMLNWHSSLLVEWAHLGMFGCWEKSIREGVLSSPGFLRG